MVLVVGGAGYIGSHVCAVLRDRNDPHRVFDNLSSGHREAIEGTELVEGDIRSAADLDRAFAGGDVDLVMHFGAYISVGESVRDPAKYFENNVFGTYTLLEAMRRHGVRSLVFSSTAAVFGEPDYVPIDEGHPKSPTSPYGESKLMVERMLASYDRAYGLKSVCLRYFNAAGAHPSGAIGEDHTPEEHLVPVAILAALGKRPPLKVFGSDYDTPDGTCVRDYIHILDLAEAHLLAADHLRSGGESRQYNLGNGEGFSVRHVIETVERASGRTVPHEDADRRPGDPARLIAASDRIRTDWGWKPRYPELETIVEHAWRWHESHPKGYSG